MLVQMAKKRKPAAPVNPWPERLRAVRKKLKLTQEQAAERIGYAGRTWMYWESATRGQAPSERAIRLIQLLENGDL